MKKYQVLNEMEHIEEWCETIKIIMGNMSDQKQTETLTRLINSIHNTASKVKGQAATKKLMTTGTITDDELLARFAATSPRTGERMFEATMIPNGETNRTAHWDVRTFSAPNKAEAVTIAREYAERIASKKLVYVYLAR